MTEPFLHFTVHPSVVYQLGESLITDAMVAIIELVKNSYDADASYSKVIIDTQGITKPDDSFFGDEKGSIITIEDDGCGMNIEEIKKGWLTISNRQKLEIKKKKNTTKKGRTPLGDKGLGRLGVQKLGKNLELFTKKRGDKGYHIGFSWQDFVSSETLDNVEIRIEEIDYHKSNGTKIVISGLMDPELWLDEKIKQEENKKKGNKKDNKKPSVIKRLQNELSCLISPYKEIRDFTVYIEIDGKSVDLIEISNSLRDNALLKYKINFDEQYFLVTGNAKLDYFLPKSPEDKKIFQKIIKKDDGNKFFEYLAKQNFAKDYKLKLSNSKKWFIDFTFRKAFSSIDEIQYIDDDTIANPGSFLGQVDAFNFNLYDEEQGIYSTLSEYKEVIKKISGIKVYRDGFAIRVDQDWLGLGQQQTTGGSYYGLRPLNTLGYISLSARDNMELEETTDREGFKDTVYYRNFNKLLREFINFSGKVQEDIRRTWLKFLQFHKETSSGVDEQDDIEDITNTIKKTLSVAPNYQKNVKTIKDKITKIKSISTDAIRTLAESEEISNELKKKSTDMLSQYENLLDEAKNTLGRTEEYFTELNSLNELPKIIDGRISDLRKHMEVMYESMALGLTAEALSHEIDNITDQLLRRSKAIKTDLSKRNITDGKILEFIEYVYSAVIALQKQMTFLSPTLNYVREKRTIINVNILINEIISYFNNRWDNIPIAIKVNDIENLSFLLKVSKGKIIQIIDNLILNSEHWLKEDIRQGKIDNGIIKIVASPPYIIIFDNGRGIDPTVEASLFDPFVTTKANGRGLGLYIVKQLLASEGCSIELLPERNKNRCLFKFQLDLGGIINE